jgi:cation diffusion facilitator CzcD-associated flavoprotein CzcO
MELDFETVVVGAGVSGIGAGIELLKNDFDSFVILEKAQDLGGTWRDNSYPGIAVDIPSIAYCFSFEMDHPWSRTYAPGAEIQDYLRHCSRKYGIDKHIEYGVGVSKIEFDAKTNTWTTQTDGGRVYRSRYVIAATGILSQPKLPEIEGLESFAGKSMHTARWDHDHDLAGEKVGVIGTGASAVQIVPSIAPDVGSLAVFQRTPIWVGPKDDEAIGAEDRKSFRFSQMGLRVRRFFTELGFEIGTYLVVNYQKRKSFVRQGEARLAKYVREVVKDPALQEKLLPNYGLGCKRPAFSNEYLQTFNRENVDLVTSGITRITESGVMTEDGVHHELDTLILSTGFKTFEKGNAPSFEVVGLDDVELGQFWHDNRYQSYAGIAVPGFPNFFLTVGPYSGGFNWFTMLDAHLKYILRCMRRARSGGTSRVEVRREAHDEYFGMMLREAEDTVFKDPACVIARSYYIDRHGDASVGLPRTPWWRALRVRFSNLNVFRFES